MRRDAEKDLDVWKNQHEPYPLLIRGARQVGKSYLVEAFAKSHFDNYVTVNFEFQPQLAECFQVLDPREIINKLQLLLGVEIKERKTLLFLDEIQECPRAIMALRYFKEKMPSLNVVGAGSLLEFVLRGSNFKMPVGRVQFLYLKPFSFGEFLVASGNVKLRRFLGEVNLEKRVDPAIHLKLLELFRRYLILGGMPAVLKEYFSSQDLAICQRIQAGILQTYRADFGKYASNSQGKYLQKVFDAAPRLAGQRVKYVNIDAESKSRDLKKALELLALAGIVKPVNLSRASGLPLGAQVNESKFKLNFLDVGLMQNACGIAGVIGTEKDVMQINLGAVVEQFVGQELMAYADRYVPGNLYFWARDKKNSAAEVDYVLNFGAEIYPLEVKAGKTGTLRSLKRFITEKKVKLGLRIYSGELTYENQILSLPLYMLEQLSRLVKTVPYII